MTIAYHRTYDSAGDWFAQCEKDEAHPFTKARKCQRTSDEAFTVHTDPVYFNWSTSRTRKEVLDFARLGWAEGREKIKEATERARPMLRSATIKGAAYDVGGAYPFVPAAIAGDPLCMVTIGDQERRTRPILRLVNEAWGSAGVEAANLVRRGAAILAHIDRLESADIRCELIHRYSASNFSEYREGARVHRSRTVNYVVDITVKRADEPLEIDRIAFLLLHPSALRRLYFGSMHTLPLECGDAWTSSYGSPPTQSAREVEHDQILIPSANEWSSSYTAQETANNRVGQFITDGIKKMGNMGFLIEEGGIIEQEAA